MGLRNIFLVFTQLFVLSLPSFALEVNTYRGSTEVEPLPQSVAVFDISAIDTLNAMDVEIAGVPNNLYLDSLRVQLKDTATAGSLFELDLEALNAIGPDLIIVGGRSSKQLDKAKRVAPTIDMTIWGDNFLEQVKSRIIDYGKIFGKDAKALEMNDALDEKISQAKQAIEGKGSALIVMTNGPKISAYGINSRFGWLHQYLQLPEAIAGIDASTHGEAVSFEFVAKANPDWLLVLDRAAAIGSSEANAQATLDNALMKKTKAYQNDQIIYLPAAEMYIAAGGFDSTNVVLDKIIAAFSK